MRCEETRHAGMSTVFTYKAYGRRSADALRAARREALRLEGLMSRFQPCSDIGRLNGSSGGPGVRVSRETFETLERAQQISGLCPNRFDITVAPLVDLWRAAAGTGLPPEAERVRGALALADPGGLVLDSRRRTAMFARPGQAADLGGIGKGYAADRLLQVFRRHGIESAVADIGGNVAALGTKLDGSPWRVGIRHPRNDAALIGCVEVADSSVVTSGDYQRYFTGRDAKRYHHILDPATGYPAESGLASVTVMAKRSMDADALSTALFVAGREEGASLLKHFPGVEAVFIGLDMGVYVTGGLRGKFQAAEGTDIKFI